MSEEHLECDVLLVGAGIMSATVATFLKELDPQLRVELFEKLDRVAAESTDAKNNAGTGHAALCELNYTPQKADGTIDIHKATKVMDAFELSKQFWGYLASQGALPAPESFVRSVPHMSFVTGAEDVAFLRRRHQALTKLPLFAHMQFSEDPSQLQEWMPLVMAGRLAEEPIAATRSELGTDVDFGALTRGLFGHLQQAFAVEPWLSHEVKDLRRTQDGRWEATVWDHTLEITRCVRARFVFIGAGGGALDLLNDSDIREGEGYGGFPVSGQWLVCKNPTLIAAHHAKVYGKAQVGAPPMSVPHLDSRYIDGEKTLLFGPFAGFSTKFLKQGSLLDLPLSFTPDNLLPMLSAGLRNVPLTRYLVTEVTKTLEDRIEALQAFLPTAKAEDWDLSIAGQRVQIIKPDQEGWGTLEFGTEIISAEDNSLAALLGASPGASTSVSIALDLLVDCFPERMKTELWQQKLRVLVPTFGQVQSDEASREQRIISHRRLGLLVP